MRNFQIKKEIQFKIDLQATQSTENCEDNVSLSDELTPESETKVEFCDEDKVKKFEMEKEFAPPYSYYSKLQEYLGIDYQKINSLDGKSYQCSKCGKQFKNKINIKYHIVNFHGGKKPYQCSICEKSYLILYNLRLHLEQSHKKDQAWLESYFDKVHEGDKPHNCPNCDTSFTVKEELDNHVKLVHEGKELQISSTGKKYFTIKLK